VSWSQIVFGVVLVLALLAVAGFFGWRQLLTLRRLRADPYLPDEERSYERSKAYRRLVSSVLMLVLAVLLGCLLAFYETPAQQIADEDPPAFTPEQKLFLRIWGGSWVAFLLILMVVVLLAAADLWATRRYALRQYRKLQEDRRAMIERQAGRIRQERNGAG
jgi:H+/gluconate symporter-like permease